VHSLGLLRIKDNIIKLINSSQAPTPVIETAKGIRIDLVTGGGFVSDNIVENHNGQSKGTGIEGNNLVRCLFQGNTTTNFNRGYHISGGYSNSLRANNAFKGNDGFEVSTSSSNNYCKNISTKQTDDGWHFMGYCKSPSNFKCNNIGSANNGLYLWGNGTDYSTLGEQNNTGNTWNAGQYGAWGAFNAYGGGLPDPIIFSKFIMPPSQIPTWSTGSGTSNLWFESLLGTPFPCGAATCPLYIDNDQVPVGVQGEPGNEVVLDDSDTRTARGQIEHQGIGWVAQQDLYERLAASPTLLSSGNNNIQEFYANESQGTIGQLYNQRLAMNTAASPDAVLFTTLNTTTTTISTALDSVEILRGLLEQTGLSAQGLPKIKEQMTVLSNNSDVLLGAWEGLDLQRTNAGAALVVSNSAISAPNLLADNEKQLNGHLLQADYFQIPSTTTNLELVNQIKAIADQCPIEGGRSVYEARSWYRRFDPLATWDDEGICGANRGVEQRSSTEADQSLSYWVLPNPANDQIQIVPILSTPQQAKFSLFRFDGQLVQQINLNDNASMNLGHLPNGIYSYTISTENGTVQSGKLIIQH
jgi:hypothetical protein